MSIKRQVIEKSLKIANKKLEEIVELWDATPLLDIIEYRKKASKILKENKGDYEKISKLIEPLAKKEKAAFELDKKIDSMDLVKDRVDLEDEIRQLNNELFMINKKEGVNQ